MIETLQATDRRIRKGLWLWCDHEPRGWFRITYRAPELDAGGKVYVAVYGRGPHYAIRLAPDDDVTVRT